MEEDGYDKFLNLLPHSAALTQNIDLFDNSIPFLLLFAWHSTFAKLGLILCLSNPHGVRRDIFSECWSILHRGHISSE